MTRSMVTDESELVDALRAGDEHAFAWLVDQYGPLMTRVARAHVPTREAAEDVVQDTWLALLQGIDRFEERSSLRTWLFRVLVNIAKTRGVREHRTIPASALGPAVEATRFFPADHADSPGRWAQPPLRWQDAPERRLVSAETIGLAERAIEQLPERQRAVVWLRDVGGYDSDEVCELLSITAGNQRVLLHRGRAVVRQALEDYL